MLLCLLSAAQAADIAIISGDDFPKNSLTAGQVKDLYLGNVEMIEGTKIFPLDQKDTDPIKKDFLKTVVGMSPDEYKSHWMKRVFRDGDAPPAVKNAAEEVTRGVREKKGTVGYIRKDEVKGKEGIKVLLTQ